MTTTDAPPSPMRLDDLFRWAVHLRPEVIFGLLTPDMIQGVRSAVAFTRLDTQLAPARYLPDIAYAISNTDIQAIVIMEGQAQARSHVQDRATTIVLDIGQCAPKTALRRQMRLIELRTLERCRTTGQPPGEPVGLIRFEPSNALLDLDPADPRFQAPETWIFLAYSQQVGPDLLDRLMANLATISQPGHPLAHTVDSTDAHLLGAISRVRFPDYAWNTVTQELLMNSAQNIEDSNVGHVTTRERRELQLQANAAAQAELVRIKAEERAHGEEAGERRILLELASTAAPDRRAELASMENLEDLKREVMALVANRG